MDCSQGFCLSHQAVAADGGIFTNLCSACLAERDTPIREAADRAATQAASERAARQQQERDALAGAKLAIKELAARLVTAGAAGLTPRYQVVGQKQTIPGWTKYRDVSEPIEPAWLVGQFDWIVHHAARTGTFECDASDSRQQRPTYVLRNGEVVSDAPPSYGFAGRPTKLADVQVWVDVARAFKRRASTL